MQSAVLGVSGSPVKNSNTDRLVQTVLEATGLNFEFIKLSSLHVRPCMACKKCVPDNICKEEDDFPALADKIKQARALIIGAYIPYGQIDGFTKALLERFWSLRHVQNLLKGKLAATIVTGLQPDVLDRVNLSLATELKDYENMDLIGQLTIQGNLPCLTCGQGDGCQMSGLKVLYGPDARTSDFGYTRVEDQQEVFNEAQRIGLLIGDRLQSSDDA